MLKMVKIDIAALEAAVKWRDLSAALASQRRPSGWI